MIQFLRKLQPYSGFLGGDSGGSSGGGGGGSSTVSDREFEAAMAEDTANRAGISGGGNYYDSGSTSAAQQQADAAALARAQAEQRAAAEAKAAQEAAAAKAAEEARLAAEAKAAEEARIAAENAAWDADLQAAIDQMNTLDAAYALGGTNITSDGLGDLSFDFYDPYSGETTTYDNTTFDEVQNRLAEAAAFESEFQTAQDQMDALDAAYNLDAFGVTSTGLGDIQFMYTDPFTGETKVAYDSEDAISQYQNSITANAEREAARVAALAEAEAQREAELQAAIDAELAQQEQPQQEQFDSLAQNLLGMEKNTTPAPTGIVESMFSDILKPSTTVAPVGSPQVFPENRTYTNELGQQYTQADIDALGQKTDTGTLIGNVANRVVNEDGTTGYLIGTGNNRMDDGRYSLSDTNYAAEGLAAQQRQAEAGSQGMFNVPSPKPDVLRNDPYDSIVPVEERLADWYDKTFEALDSKNPESYVEYDNYVQPSATQTMNAALESGQGISDLTLDNYNISDMDGFLGSYSEKNLGVDFADKSQGIYGTGPEGFNNFLGAAEKAKENGSTWFTGEPDLAIAPNGTVVAEDPVSFGNIIRQIMGGLANQVIGGIAGGIVGNLVYSLAGGFKAPLYSALFTKSAVQGLSPIQSTTYVDENGKEYVESSFFGSTTFQTMDEIIEAQAERNKRYDAGVGEGGSSEYTGGLEAPIKNLDAAVKSNPSWKDAYNSVSGIDISGAIIGAAGNLNLTPLAGSTLEAATYLVQGENPITAVVKAFGDDLVANLPDGYSQITESAALMMVGVSPVEALAEVYGTELLGDSPAAAGAIKGAVALDQGKSPEEALGIAAYHYFKNGGTLPDFEAPSFLQGEGIDLPSIDLSFIEDGAQAAWEFAKGLMPDINLDIAWDGDVPSLPNFPDFDMSGLVDALKGTAQDVSDWVASIQGPSIDLPSVDLPSVDIDLPDIDLDIFGNMLAGRSTGATNLDAVLTSSAPTSNFVDSSTPLSRQVLKRGYKQV
jgi:hypothetical protein